MKRILRITFNLLVDTKTAIDEILNYRSLHTGFIIFLLGLFFLPLMQFLVKLISHSPKPLDFNHLFLYIPLKSIIFFLILNIFYYLVSLILKGDKNFLQLLWVNSWFYIFQIINTLLTILALFMMGLQLNKNLSLLLEFNLLCSIIGIFGGTIFCMIKSIHAQILFISQYMKISFKKAIWIVLSGAVMSISLYLLIKI